MANEVQVDMVLPQPDETGVRVPTNQVRIRRPDGSIRVGTVNNQPSRTQQHFKEDCDINNIIKRHRTQDPSLSINRRQGVYADVSEYTDYPQMLQKVIDAQRAFMDLGSDVRLRFQNDPAQLIQFLNDPKNYDEGVRMGLLVSRKEAQELGLDSDIEIKSNKKIKKDSEIKNE